MVKVSIVIPIYNAYKYLSICVDSIINQTYENIEIIAVDDKSTDKSLTLLKDYKKKFKDFKIIPLKKNQGVSHARNTGIEAATGDYILFIDSDDFLDKDAISKMVQSSIKYAADVVEAKRLFWYRRGTKLLTFTETSSLKEDLILESIDKDIRSITMPRYVTGKLYKRSVIGDIRFDESIRCYEDALFNHAIKGNFKRYVYVSDVFYHYLQRPSSLINTISTNHMDYAYAGTKIKDIYEKHNYYGLDIKNLIDDNIIEDILVILSIKIPKMKLSNDIKKKCVSDFLDLVENLSLSKNKLSYKIAFSLFKNNIFLTIYFALTSHLNLIDLGFRFLNRVNGHQITNQRLIKKVLTLYNKMN